MNDAQSLREGKQVQAGPFSINCHETGEGDAVIMLHGGGPGASAWSNFSDNVAAFSSSNRVLLVDMLGYGKSDSVVFNDEPATTVRARAIRDFMDKLGIKRANFVGNSMGGTVAMAFAVDFPNRVNRLVLIGAAGMTRTLIAPQPTEGHRRIREAAADPNHETMLALAKSMLFDPEAISSEIIEDRVRAAQNESHRRAADESTAPWRDQTGELSKIAAKTLIVWGREDRVNPLEIGLLLLRDIPDSRLHIFKNCGHWAQVEHRDEFNRIALAFLGDE